jgi:oligopeptide transport system ATP-binding protein
MYLGKIVEMASSDALFSNPMHPYTQALMSAIPIPDVDKKWDPILLKGEPPSPLQRPKGCCFHPRCPKAFQVCDKENVSLNKIDAGHFVACHLFAGADD